MGRVESASIYARPDLGMKDFRTRGLGGQSGGQSGRLVQVALGRGRRLGFVAALVCKRVERHGLLLPRARALREKEKKDPSWRWATSTFYGRSGELPANLGCSVLFFAGKYFPSRFCSAKTRSTEQSGRAGAFRSRSLLAAVTPSLYPKYLPRCQGH